jgi:hypothetical protein
MAQGTLLSQKKHVLLAIEWLIGCPVGEQK